MKRLQVWQWLVVVVPMAAIILFLIVAASLQIHRWHLSWLWAVFALVVLGWRWVLVDWFRPPELDGFEVPTTPLPGVSEATESELTQLRSQAAAAIQQQLLAVRSDVLPWEDWALFFQRCQDLIVAIAHVYHPEVKRPLLNIYIPQAYGLLRDTVEDLDRWMQALAPMLGQVTVGQAYQAYETYQKLEPAARTALKIYNWARWIFNPVAAIAVTATQPARTQANQKLLSNLGQLVRETALTALGERAIALYSGQPLPSTSTVAVDEPSAPTQSLQALFEQAQPSEQLQTQPLQILVVGRTGAGKSSVINTLFLQALAQVDVLPSTDQLQSYCFTAPTGDQLLLWDTPGYEQVGRFDLRAQVLAQAKIADLILLVTPALDPALQMDRDFLETLHIEVGDLPIITVVSQVDGLRPFREWQPPYDWQRGERAKEQSIRGAVTYRQSTLGDLCPVILPLVTAETAPTRQAWGRTELCQQLLDHIAPAQQLRLARFLDDQTARVQAANRIIDGYAVKMSTAQGLTQLLKSPILTVLSTLMTGNKALAAILATGLPVEQAPIVLGKLQLAWELCALLTPNAIAHSFDLLTLWPLLLETHEPILQDTWALGHALVEYWLAMSLAQEASEHPTFISLQNSYHQFLTQASAEQVR